MRLGEWPGWRGSDKTGVPAQAGRTEHCLQEAGSCWEGGVCSHRLEKSGGHVGDNAWPEKKQMVECAEADNELRGFLGERHWRDEAGSISEGEGMAFWPRGSAA